MIEFMGIRYNSQIHPATNHDTEQMKKLKQGDPVRVECYQLRPRSIQHHKLFFAMLQLTLDYWTPAGHMITPSELQALKRFTEWAEKQTGNAGALKQLGKVYLKELSDSRKRQYSIPEKTIEGLLEWVKLKVGHVTRLMTPDGIKIETKSINFNSMNQAEFDVFYKRAFNVCWTLVMSKHFESEQECQNVIDQLSGMS